LDISHLVQDWIAFDWFKGRRQDLWKRVSI